MTKEQENWIYKEDAYTNNLQHLLVNGNGFMHLNKRYSKLDKDLIRTRHVYMNINETDKHVKS